MLDLIIRNARIVDGSGGLSHIGDIGVRDGVIAQMGTVEGPTVAELDAAGRVVAPGFIDVHTHYDAQVFWDPTLSPSCYHGVTTVFGGFCGFSIAPLSPEAAPYLLRMLSRVEGMPIVSLEQGVPWSWRSFADYLLLLEGKVGLNVGFMAGHSTIRRVVMGERASHDAAGPEDMAAMKRLLTESLAAGAMGFSTSRGESHSDAEGLPVPSRQADRNELVELAAVCRGFPGASLEIQPGLNRFDAETVQLLVDMSVAAQRPINWNLLQAGDSGLVSHQLAAADAARAQGGEIIALTPPQTPTARVNLHSGFVFDALEGWAQIYTIPPEERIRLLADPAVRAELDRSAKQEKSPVIRKYAEWQNFTIDAAFSPETKPFEGMTVGEIAKEQKRAPFDVMLDISIADGLRTSFILRTDDNDPELWRQRGDLWRDSRAVIGASDAGAHLDMIDTFAFSTQLLGLGVRRFGVISLEEAVRQITWIPAQLFGLKDRGLLKPGWRADLVIFDPEEVGRGSTYIKRDLPGDEPRIYAEATGIAHVFVNGVEIVRQGQHTGALPGSVLRSGRDTESPAMPVDAGAIGLAAM